MSAGDRRKGMKAVFCVDHIFVRDEDGAIYSAGQFPYELWRRYLQIFDALTVIGRCRPPAAGESAGHLNRSSGPMVSFAFVPNLASLVGLAPWRRRQQARTIITAAMVEADAVIARLPSENGLLAAGLAPRLAKPLAVEAVACSWDQLWNYGTVRGKLYAPVQMWRMRRATRQASFTLYVSHYMQQRYPTAGAGEVIPDVDLVSPSVAVLSRRLERISRAEGRLVLGLIGSIQHKYKGVHTALEALGRIRDAYSDIEFRVLGPGDPRPWQEMAVRYRIGDRVRFCGVVPAGEPVMQWLDDIDIYLQPSFQESLGRALIEAMSRGCPAFGSTTGGIPDLLPSECLHRPGDARRLGELICAAARDPGWRAAQARRNFEVARHHGRDRLDGRRAAFLRRFAQSAALQPSRSDLALAGRSEQTPEIPR
jgi:glycosyltransferase involved in cell wall biosynthesis